MTGHELGSQGGEVARCRGRGMCRFEAAVHLYRDLVVGTRGWKRFACAFGAGAFSVLALAPFFFAPILFLTFPILVWLMDRPAGGDLTRLGGVRSAAATGWWFGFGYFIAGLFWIGEAFLVEAEKYAYLIPFAVTLLPCALSFFFAAAAGIAKLFWRPGFGRVLILAFALTFFEWLRGHVFTGFPWNLIGYALTWPLPLMQAASLVGVYGLTPWVVGMASAPLVVAADQRERRSGTGDWRGVYGTGVLLLAFLTFGLLRLWAPQAASVEGVKFRLVQPSIAQREKWVPENQGRIFKEHLELSAQNSMGEPDGMAGITHVVWSEAAMPFLPLEHPEAISAIADALPPGTHLLAGGLRLAKEGQGSGRHLYNSLIAFDTDGAAKAIYDKNHLVPFGEYLPFSQVFRMVGLRGLVEMRGAFDSGPEPRPLYQVPGLPPAGALICYEAIFPGEVVQGRERPSLLLSVTNDGWFGNTTGPRQHFHQARVRAVEEGLPLVRTANNGISAVVDSEGRIAAKLDLNDRGTLDSSLPGVRSPTLYARVGDWMVVLQALLLACGLAVTRGRTSFYRV